MGRKNRRKRLEQREPKHATFWAWARNFGVLAMVCGVGFAAATWQGIGEKHAVDAQHTRDEQELEWQLHELRLVVARAEGERDGAVRQTQLLEKRLASLQIRLDRVAIAVERLAPGVIAVSESNEGENIIRLAYGNETSRLIRFASQVTNPIIVQFGQDDRPIVVVGVQQFAKEPGRLRAFYADDPASATENPLRDEPMGVRSEWTHQVFGESTLVHPLLATDLDGKPGDELVVVVNHLQGPSRVVVFTDGFEILSEFIHYGHIKEALAANVYGTSRKELILWGIGNQRDKVRMGEAISEPFHTVVFVIDPLNANTGRWSMNPWMNTDPRFVPPIGYGHCREPWSADSTNAWIPEKYFEFDPVASELRTIRVVFTNGYMLELDGEMNVKRIDPHSGELSLEVANPSEIWTRMWPE